MLGHVIEFAHLLVEQQNQMIYI